MKKISICIPAYKRPANLKRLLASVAAQSFRDFEVVITDDSPDDSVKKVVETFYNLPIHYFKNAPALGTPANWNRGIALAEGEWIKLMHDDDWFASPQSLQRFAEKTEYGKKFIFSRYKNVFEDGAAEMPAFPQGWKKKVLRQPMVLISQNVIGPPSVTLIHRSIKQRYDERMKWRVDQEFYIRLLQQEKDYALIDEPLINVGISDTQVTNDCLNNPDVELPEGLILLGKNGVKPLKNLLVYDAWWRILRNNGIRSERQLQAYVKDFPWPAVVLGMLLHQTKISGKLLQIGAVSKAAMFWSFMRNQRNFQ